jgi:GT2 family glycosyltransferase
LPARPHTLARKVPWVLGAALAIRRDAFQEVGGFDESFFMYSEEVDRGYRQQAAGWQNHWAPVTTVVHVHGASTIQRRADMAIRTYTSTKDFYRRHYSGRQMVQLRLIMVYSKLRNIGRDILRLLYTRQKEKRARIAEDLGIWQHVLFCFARDP